MKRRFRPWAAALALTALLASCGQKAENASVSPWQAAMGDAVFAEDEEVRPLVTLTAGDDRVIWDDAGERVLLLTWHDYPDACDPGTPIGEYGDIWATSLGEMIDWYSENGEKMQDPALRFSQLLGDEALSAETGLNTVPLSKIEPRADQPREYFDEEKLEELAQSIREHGLIQPITVRPVDGGYYQIIAGERRWRAARLAGLAQVPVNIIDADDRKTAELALIENLQREDLNPIEEAKGYRALIEGFKLTQEQAADRVGKSRPAVANALRLLKLPEEIQELLEAGKLSTSQARAVAELSDRDAQAELARRVANEGLSVRETTALAKKLASAKKPAAPKKNPRLGPDGVDYIAQLEQEMSLKLGRRVRVDAGTRSGSVKLEYYGQEDFERLCDALMTLKEVYRK